MSKAMLCKLVGLFVLSIAVAACSSDDGGGAAGSGGTGGAPVDQCVNEPDKGYVESGALAAAAQRCGQSTCVGLMVELITSPTPPTEEQEAEAATCIRDCVLMDQMVDGVSTSCAQCFGNSSACGATAGCNVCIMQDSCDCLDCLDDASCQTEIDECTGVIRDFTCTP